MSVRRWFRSRLLSGEGEDAGDSPPARSFLDVLLGKGGERVRTMGQYSKETYPREIREQVARRQEVAAELLEIDIADREARVEAIPRLQKLLQKYPHPLVYETLIHAYVDAGRYEDAKGVAFAARERRREVSRSEHPEIRAEIDRLREWTTEEVEELRR